MYKTDLEDTFPSELLHFKEYVKAHLAFSDTSTNDNNSNLSPHKMLYILKSQCHGCFSKCKHYSSNVTSHGSD